MIEIEKILPYFPSKIALKFNRPKVLSNFDFTRPLVLSRISPITTFSTSKDTKRHSRKLSLRVLTILQLTVFTDIFTDVFTVVLTSVNPK